MGLQRAVVMATQALELLFSVEAQIYKSMTLALFTVQVVISGTTSGSCLAQSLRFTGFALDYGVWGGHQD